ncbi:MAG: hypothetical protein JNL11_09640 [Bdellovibrionaceae bacterium]|nr:hypothetical protein [Pseudobdellovibrionaceae bacterium]
MKSWIENIIKYRKLTIVLVLLITAGLMSQLRGLKVTIDADDSLPQNYPYVITNNLIEKIFGSKYSAAIGITEKEGSIYNPNLLAKVKRITDKLADAPGVVKGNINSLAARKSKAITGNEEGTIVRSNDGEGS